MMLLCTMLYTGCFRPAKAAEPETEEEGLTELQPLLDVAPPEDMEGMDLEQLTEAVTGVAMGEYLNSENGFSMQYPASFSFGEEGGTATAVSEDGQIHMMIESMNRGEGLSAEVIQQAVMMDSPDAKMIRYDESGCIRFERVQDDGSLLIDLYVFTETMVHHVSIACAEQAEASLFTYLEYMIHSITTNETELG